MNWNLSGKALGGSVSETQTLTGNVNGASRLGGTAIPRGNDGISPVVEIETYDWGNVVKITDIEGTKSFAVNHGTGGSGGGGMNFSIDETLTLQDGVLSVNTTDLMEQDNTLPITSAGVYSTVGNIEALLKTI